MARADERYWSERGANRTATDTVTAETASGRRLPPGATVGRYVVLHFVGEGGMGVVYAAQDFALDRRVSLKLVQSGKGADAELRRARLLGEAQALARVAHPNVVAVHDVGTFGDEVYVALEHVPGVTLGAWLRSAPRTPRAICDVFAQVGRGLLAVHAAGLVHRDVKPDNVLLGEDGRARLADFGLAVSAGGEGDASAGTPGYMPVEQLRGEPVDARADQFALAVALFEALTGDRPYGARGASRAALQERLGRGVPADVPRLSGVSPGLRRALRRALSPAVGERFPSLATLVEALEARSSGRPRTALPLGLTAVAALLVLVVGAARALDASSGVAGQGWAVPEAPRAASSVPPPSLLERPAPVQRGVQEAPSSVAVTTGRTSSEVAVHPATPLSHAATGPALPGVSAPSRQAGASRPRSEPLLPLDALVEDLGGLAQRLRAALETAFEAEARTLWGAAPTLGPAVPDGARAFLPPSSSGASAGGSSGPVQADGSALRIAALKQQLTESIASGGDPTHTAEVRFALAQALSADPSQRAQALALVQQAKEDLSTAPDTPSAQALLRQVDEWLKQYNSHVPPGSSGGNLMREAPLAP
jgi:serine/threonine protein kinase